MAEVRAEVQRMRQAPQETPEQEAAKLALMEPEQRQEYRFNKAQQAMERRLAAIQYQTADAMDKGAFAAQAASNPVLKRLAPAVEKKMAELRAQGMQNIPDRSVLAKFLLGEQILERAPKAVERQRSEGERRIAQQRGRGGAGRSDQGAERAEAVRPTCGVVTVGRRDFLRERQCL